MKIERVINYFMCIGERKVFGTQEGKKIQDLLLRRKKKENLITFPTHNRSDIGQRLGPLKMTEKNVTTNYRKTSLCCLFVTFCVCQISAFSL